MHATVEMASRCSARQIQASSLFISSSRQKSVLYLLANIAAALWRAGNSWRFISSTQTCCQSITRRCFKRSERQEPPGKRPTAASASRLRHFRFYVHVSAMQGLYDTGLLVLSHTSRLSIFVACQLRPTQKDALTRISFTERPQAGCQF